LINRGQLFDSTAKSVADGVLVVDAEGFVQEINPIAEQLLRFELDRSKAVQIQTVMPLANEETGIAVTPVQDALSQASNIEVSESLLLKVRGAEPPGSCSLCIPHTQCHGPGREMSGYIPPPE